MQPLRFDIAIAGDSLAARMAAALLAKHGKRVLLLATARYRDPWQHSSLFIEQLLGVLGGRDVLADSQPFQVLSSRARVTIRQNLPLDRELRREFGPAAPLVTTLLDELERSGTLLEKLIWEHGGLPSGGMRNTLTWRWQCLRHKLPLAQLKLPLTKRLHGVPEPAGEWLRDLFQGLSLRPLATLTVADAALLWAHARRSGGLVGEELNSLLHKRFEQFHGTEIRLDTLSALEHGHGHWSGTLPDGKRFQAGQLILGDLDHHLPGHGPLPLQQTVPSARHFATSSLDGQISALLENRVIAGGHHPVRLSLMPQPERLTGEISSGPGVDEASVRCQLESILPFAQYTLSPGEKTRRELEIAGAPDSPSLFNLPVRLGNHLWCADETRLLPQLGNCGAALLAWTLVRQIDPTIITHGD